VVIRGRAEVVTAVEEKVAVLNALMAVHEGVAGFSRITAADPAVAACQVVAVHIERMSGKSGLAQNKSDADKATIRAYLEQRGLPGDLEAARLMR
jgi:predicted FMN-binding regulatory protein PaiB